MDRTKALACLIVLVCAACGSKSGSSPRIVVGSKNFTEQVLLGEILAQIPRSLSRDSSGSRSPYLAKILKTHWLRTLLVNAYAAILLAWTIIVT